MSQKEDLRYAAKGIYEGNSTRISDCFVLEGLKNIDVIYVTADAPAWVKEIAVQLKQMVKKQYPDTDTEIVLIKPLFNRFSYPDNYLLWNVYHSLGELCLKNEENEKLLLCGTNEAAAMMRLHSTAVKKYGLKHLPSLFLDVDAYRRCSSYPLADAAERADTAGLDATTFAPYQRKKYIQAEYFVVYASGSECWQDLIHAWHANKQLYAHKPRIIYVDDLRRWTSVDYADAIFKKFSNLLRRMAIREPEITIIASAEPQLVLNIIDNKPSIAFIPQLKTYLCNKMVSEGLAFDICEKEFEEYWNVAGPIALQFFCQELKEFMTDWPEHRCQQFDKLFVNRRFKNWNLKLYWWNYKVRLGYLCRQIFLSEFGIYR